MSKEGLHLESGTFSKNPQSPKTIQALSEARERSLRLIVGGIILGLLVIIYGIGLVYKCEGIQNILVVIGSGLGFIFGQKTNSNG